MNLDNMRRFGVEVEFVSELDLREMAAMIERNTGQQITVTGYGDKQNKWRLKRDSSVRGRGANGMELVTPILKGEADLQKLLSILDVCNRYGTVNRTCGVHVHIDITNADVLPLRKLQKFFAKYEHAINGLLSESRRGSMNGYCRDHFEGHEKLYDIFGRINRKNKRKLISTGEFSSRGKWNFQNYWEHGTVENRSHQGTLSRTKVENWVRLTQAFVEAAFEHRGVVAREDDTVQTYTTKNMLDDLRGKGVITLPLKKFYMKRYKELNNEICR